ncbi:MAG TPA: PSD1 and planctomycete cytochrome C domain-containing protein, partial [Candidatus Binatia bacterium]|nr:PSD1 and planctomycete cytochrome C domain-containing protein [Candidatus Binatia bacterium]
MMPSLASVLLCLFVALSASAEKLQYNRDIRPILSDNCFRCHGPDKAIRKARLRLDQREVALEREAFVPGKADQSELVKRIFSSDPEEMMPPPESQKHLTDAQKETLRRWIAEGAEYQPHWAYIKPARPPLPPVKNRAWVRTPVDAFILKELEARNIQPSPEADKATFLRRLSLDITGLPPRPEDFQRRDADPVERLLASPHYGERMAVPWLDAVRFADTVGYHGDQNQNIFPYRDYVINAFNCNKPFDQFTVEQIAGDLLKGATTEQRVASGFNRLNMMTREGGAQPKEYLAKYAADRVRTVATTWLGSTMACCECHDHKFDPFTTKDFYQMEAFFADIKQWGVYNDYSYTPNPDLKGWSNDHPFPPEIDVDSPYLQARKEHFRKRIREFMAANVDQNELATWLESARAFLAEHATGWVTPEPIPGGRASSRASASQISTNITITSDHVIVFHARRGATNDFQLEPGPGTWKSLRLDLVPHESHADKILREKAENRPIQVSVKLKQRKIEFFLADATHKEPTYSNGSENFGVEDGWKPDSHHLKSEQTAVYVFKQPITLRQGDSIAVTIRSSSIGAARISLSPFGAPEPLALLKLRVLDPADVFLLSSETHHGLARERQQLQRELLECRNGRSPTLVSVSSEPMVTRVLPRGNWQDESGEIVEPDVPSFLKPARTSVSGRASVRASKSVLERGGTTNRLHLARWLVSPENPLTARTFVNRLWKQFFGAGICNTVDDFGYQGDPPSHPELLDWLAVEFQESGWDIKHMVRLMVLSSTYRQSSNLRQELRETDPSNRLLASQNPRRLEAEFVRDNALAISDLLNEDVGGPSVHPYQPAGYYANLQFP